MTQLPAVRRGSVELRIDSYQSPLALWERGRG